MSKLSTLVGKPRTFKIRDLELELKPLTLADMDLILEMEDPEKRSKALKEIIFRTLKDSVPEATEEEINSVAIENFKEITEAILEVNGLKKDVSA